MNNELTVLHVCSNIEEAYLFRSTLEGSGIEAFIPDEQAMGLNYPGIAIEGVRLLVRNSDLERARSILAAVEPEKR
ncbi:MAG: DUF2007 domain-containing protein [Acidobacteria bacterium]|nr:DUF2007 domain-containing protein [Acidobacteriota bacterium]